MKEKSLEPGVLGLPRAISNIEVVAAWGHGRHRERAVASLREGRAIPCFTPNLTGRVDAMPEPVVVHGGASGALRVTSREGRVGAAWRRRGIWLGEQRNVFATRI